MKYFHFNVSVKMSLHYTHFTQIFASIYSLDKSVLMSKSQSRF